MIELYIVSTGKGYGKKDTWKKFDSKKKSFIDMSQAKSYLKTQYGNCKRVPIYIDKKNNQGSIKCGYVYSYHNSDISHVPVEKWIQRDWIEFREVTTLEVK